MAAICIILNRAAASGENERLFLDDKQGRKVEQTIREDHMVILVFLLFVVMFGTAGVFLSIEAKRRNDSNSRKPVASSRDATEMGQTVSDRIKDRAA
jgi:hypothetical protein